jgi:hypothetical protein
MVLVPAMHAHGLILFDHTLPAEHPGEPDMDTEDWFEDISAFDLKQHAGMQLKDRTSNDYNCARSSFLMSSQEDVLSQRTACSNTHLLRHIEFDGNKCDNPYGRFIQAPGHNFFYVEIPKTGSSSVKSMLNRYLTDHAIPFNETDIGSIKAFAFIRHPITRFLSGYGTVMKRLKMGTTCIDPVLKFVLDMPEPQRFNEFVDLFVKQGEKVIPLYHCSGLPCVMQHVMSQTWFLNFWPGPTDLYRVEGLVDEVKRLAELTQLDLSLPQKNSNEGHIDQKLFMEQNASMQKLHSYFKEDLIRFGYQPLLGF